MTSTGEPEKPPTYEESSQIGFVNKMASTSSGVTSLNGSSIQISLDKLPQSSSASGSSVSVDQMVEELSALQRAQMHLYKRLQHVKSQTYAALALVLLMAGLIVIFLVTYQSDKSVVTEMSHRTGKALASSSSASLLSSNSVEDDTQILLKHLSQLTSLSTTPLRTMTPPSTDKTLKNIDDPLHPLNIAKSKEISIMSNALNGEPDDSMLDSTNHSNGNIITLTNSEATSTVSTTTMGTTTTTTTTTTTNESEIEEFETETEKITPLQDIFNISIVIHSATVPNMDYLPMGRASDTYCDVFIDDVLIGSTPIVDNNNNPNWQYLLPKFYKVRKDSSIRVDLLDRDHLKKDHIGGVVMLVGDLVNTGRMNRPVKLFHGRGDVWVTVKLV